MDWSEKRVLVVGCGISGIGAAALLLRKGARVTLYDENEHTDRAKISQGLPENCPVTFSFGEIPEIVAESINLVVLSPGVPSDSPLVEELRSRGLPIIGEIELAGLCSRGKLIAITGTNGKTTTTALTGQIMKDYYPHVYIVGNIGNPYTGVVEQMEEDSVTVAEISSFQLETTEEFHPQISAILNITPDHLNRHHTMENYIAAKERIAYRQNREDICVLNYEDSSCRRFSESCPAQTVFFSSARPLENGYYLQGKTIYRSLGGKEQRLLDTDELKLLGVHNMENVMAAIAMAESFGVPMENILETVRNFSAVEHRIEYVASINGVAYYNDSKATNPDAAIKAIEAMNCPTVLIGGGYDKDNEFGEWIDSFGKKVICLVLLGQTREKIAQCAREKGFTAILFADSLEEAVKQATDRAGKGEAVLLSPACASWGMFPNYEVRGRLFKEYVMRLKES